MAKEAKVILWDIKFIPEAESHDDMSHLYIRCPKCKGRVEMLAYGEGSFFNYCPFCGEQLVKEKEDA